MFAPSVTVQSFAVHTPGLLVESVMLLGCVMVKTLNLLLPIHLNPPKNASRNGVFPLSISSTEEIWLFLVLGLLGSAAL
jgi:hypothetical protein